MSDAAQRVQFIADLAGILDGDESLRTRHAGLLARNRALHDLERRAEILAASVAESGSDFAWTTQYQDGLAAAASGKAPAILGPRSKLPRTTALARRAPSLPAAMPPPHEPSMLSGSRRRAERRGGARWVIPVASIAILCGAVAFYLRSATPDDKAQRHRTVQPKASAPEPALEAPKVRVMRWMGAAASPATTGTRTPELPSEIRPGRVLRVPLGSRAELRRGTATLWIDGESRVGLLASGVLRLHGRAVIRVRAQPSDRQPLRVQCPVGAFSLASGMVAVSSRRDQTTIEVLLGEADIAAKTGEPQAVAMGLAARINDQGLELRPIPDPAASLRVARADDGLDQPGPGRLLPHGQPAVERPPVSHELAIRLSPTLAETTRTDVFASAGAHNLDVDYQARLVSGARLLASEVADARGFWPAQAIQEGNLVRIAGLRLPAGEALRVRLRYDEPLVPLAFGERYRAPLGSPGPDGSKLKVRIETTGGEAPWSHHHDLGQTAGHLVADAEPIAAAGDLVLDMPRVRAPKPLTLHTPTGRPGGTRSVGAVLGIHPTLARAQPSAVDWVLIIDRSQSMAGPAWAAASAFAGELATWLPSDHGMAVLACDAECDVLSARAALPDTNTDKAVAEFLRRQQPGGPTDLARALSVAGAQPVAFPEIAGRRHALVYVGDGHASLASSASRVAAAAHAANSTTSATSAPPPAPTVSTVAVGAHADRDALRAVSAAGGGHAMALVARRNAQWLALRLLHRVSLGDAVHVQTIERSGGQGEFDALGLTIAPGGRLWLAITGPWDSLVNGAVRITGQLNGERFVLSGDPVDTRTPARASWPPVADTGRPLQRAHELGSLWRASNARAGEAAVAQATQQAGGQHGRRAPLVLWGDGALIDERAENGLQAATNVASSGPDGHAALARALARAADLPGTQKATNAWLASAPKDLEAHLIAIGTEFRLGERARAIRALRGLSELAPRDALLHAAIAERLTRVAAHRAACQHRAAAADLEPADPALRQKANECRPELKMDSGAQGRSQRAHPTGADVPRARARRDARARQTLTVEATWTSDDALDIVLVDHRGHTISALSFYPDLIRKQAPDARRVTLHVPGPPVGVYGIELVRAVPGPPSAEKPVSGRMLVSHGPRRESNNFEMAGRRASLGHIVIRPMSTSMPVTNTAARVVAPVAPPPATTGGDAAPTPATTGGDATQTEPPNPASPRSPSPAPPAVMPPARAPGAASDSARVPGQPTAADRESPPTQQISQ